MSAHTRSHPQRFGLTLRQCSGRDPDLQAVNAAAELLARNAYFTDDDGYDCDILAAAIHADGEHLTYIEQRSKSGSKIADVKIRIHLVAPSSDNRSVEIKSYNPFFGCNVRYLAWHDDSVVCIYREKRHAYAVTFGPNWPPTFRVIGERWKLNDSTLAYVTEDGPVARLSIPQLNEMDTISVSDAQSFDLYPDELTEFLDWPENAV